jgi:pseudaminic acid synthase
MKKKFINKNPFFIGEISSNHCGSINIAKKIILNAKKNGFDAVKLQTYTPDCMTHKKNNFIIKHGIWKNRKLWDLYNNAKTPLDWHEDLFNYAKKIKIKIFSTPFCEKCVEFLETLNCPAYKISSFEITDLKLIKKIALTKKPIIMSTGLANLKEIGVALKLIKKYGNKDVTLLYCVSNYPSNLNDFNINIISLLKKKFKCRIGLSDHSNSYLPAVLSVSRGAEIFEKHLALKNKIGEDYKFSLKDKEIGKYKNTIIDASKMINNKKFTRSVNEMKNVIFRRSVYAVKNLKKGEKIESNKIENLRPALGLTPSFFNKIIGKKTKKKIKIGSPINIEDLE